MGIPGRQLNEFCVDEEHDVEQRANLGCEHSFKMKIWVGVTDKRWFEHLLLRKPDEVNFWQPSGTRNFRVLVTDAYAGAFTTVI